MLKNFNKLPKQPKYFNIYNSYHSMFTWPSFLFFQHYQQYDTLLPITPCMHNLKAGIAYCTWVPWIQWCWPYSYIEFTVLSCSWRARYYDLIFQMMSVVFLMSSTDALEWYRVGDFFLRGHHFRLHHLTRHHFQPYHLDHLFHYHNILNRLKTSQPLK
jgi:hypothetical protein